MVRRFTFLVACAAVSTACGSKATHDPFSVEPEQLVGRLQNLALPRVAHPENLPVTDTILSRFQSGVATTLDGAGFTVIGQDDVAGIWEPILDDIGGYYDPRTGGIIEEKRKAANQRLRRQLRVRYGVDAIVYAELIIVDAPYSDGVARWDGTSQSVAGFWDKLFETVGAVADALVQEPHVSSLPVGTAPAVTLQVVVEDLEGRELYVNWGGVAVIADVETGEWLEPAEAFQDAKRFERAVDIAMQPLVQRTVQQAQVDSSKIGNRK